MAKKYIQDFKSKLATGGTVSPEDLQDFFSRLEGDLKDKKYGLVWESQTEQVIEQLKTNKVYLEEDVSLKITQEPGKPKSNILIEGDNYEALTYLNEINQKVDVIYIDPPYNTGNKDFIYNDRFIDKEDGFRHSQWLSFMDARLRLARELLTDDGVIFISIDDNEQAQLKLLCDEVFGESSFVSSFIWQRKVRPSNKAVSGVSTNTEYIHCYSKTEKIIFNRDELSGKGRKVYSNPDNDPRGEWRTKPLWSESNTNTKKELRLEDGTFLEKKWFVSQETLDELYRDGKIYKSSTGTISQKIYLSDNKGSVPMNTLFSDRFKTTEHSTKELKDILGESIFSYPKPVDLIKYLVKLHINPNATVLDFFAGSGTTGHAVLELNKEDGGNRQFILVTNNENNIARDVTYERNKRVIEGYTTPKGKDVSGISSNLAYYRTKQVSKYDIGFDEVMLKHVIPTIQLTEGVYSRTQHSPHTTQLGDSIFIFTQYMVEDDEIDTLIGLVKDEDILYIQEGQVDYIKTKLPDGVVYKYLEDVLPTNR